MKGATETLMKCKGFVGWKWEDEFQKALSAYKPNSDDAAVERMRLFIVTDFVEFVLEVVNEELRLGLYADVGGLSDEGIVGTVDFEDRTRDLAAVERRIAAWGRVPRICRTGPILDRLLACTEFVKAPDRLEFGEFKRECLTRFRNDGSISRAVEFAKPDGSHDDPFKTMLGQSTVVSIYGDAATLEKMLEAADQITGFHAYASEIGIEDPKSQP